MRRGWPRSVAWRWATSPTRSAHPSAWPRCSRQALRQPAAAPDGQPLPTVAPRRLFRDGFLVALLNPKTTLFFAAFIPQFLQPGGSQAAQALTLSLLFVAIAAATDSAYALLAGVMKPLLRAAGRGRWVAAALVYFALGLYAALGGSRPAAPRA